VEPVVIDQLRVDVLIGERSTQILGAWRTYGDPLGCARQELIKRRLGD
jgi:hypothetical protein